MNTRVQLTLRGIPQSDAIRERVNEEVARLERQGGQLLACKVVIEKPHRHHSQGGHFSVRLDINAPGVEFVVSREHSEDVYAAMHAAFLAATRQLHDHASHQRNRSDRARPAAPADAGEAES